MELETGIKKEDNVLEVSKEVFSEEDEKYNKNIIEEFGPDYNVIRTRIKGFLESKEPRLVKLVDSNEFGPSFIKFIHESILSEYKNLNPESNLMQTDSKKINKTNLYALIEKGILNNIRNKK